MGGYGAYVWPSFFLAMLVMLGMAVISLRALKQAQHMLQAIAHSDEA